MQPHLPTRLNFDMGIQKKGPAAIPAIAAQTYTLSLSQTCSIFGRKSGQVAECTV